MKIIIFLALFPSLLFANYDPNSKFESARSFASILDVMLLDIKQSWNLNSLIPPNKKQKFNYHLISESKLYLVDLQVIDNRIRAYFSIKDLERFLTFSEEERVELLKVVFSRISYQLSTATKINLGSNKELFSGEHLKNNN